MSKRKNTQQQTYKLMIKVHRRTKLKYLCVTSKKNWKSYKGSGIYWKSHLKKYGSNIKTILIFESLSIEKISELGLFYSEKYNIVESDDWANLIPENGYNTNILIGKQGIINYNNKVGIHSPKYSRETRKKWSKIGGFVGGKTTKKNKVGIFSETYDFSKQSKINYQKGLAKLSEEERSENGRRGGLFTKENVLGIFGASNEERKIWAVSNGRKGGVKSFEEKLGVFSASSEQRKEWCSIAGKSGGKVVGSMYWWNNGVINTKSNSCPGDGWKRGQIESEKKIRSREKNFSKYNKINEG